MTDMRMEKNVKQIKTWDKNERERERECVCVCVCVCVRERAGKRCLWFLSRKEKPNTLGSYSMCIVFSSALSITRK